MNHDQEDYKNTEYWQMAERIREKLQNDPYRQAQRRKREEEERAQEEQERLERERSERIRKFRAMQENSIRYFMLEASCLRLDPKEKTPSALIYDGYCRWCEEQGILPETIRTFCLHLKKNAREYKIAPTNFIWQGRHIRGFRGIGLAQTIHT